MTSMMLGDSTLESLTPCVNAPWLPYLNNETMVLPFQVQH